MYQPDHFTEWHLNEILSFLFTGNKDYMLIFQDSDLHYYHFVDKHHPTKYRDEREKAQKIVYRQDFRPDAVLIDGQGQSYVLETKLAINSRRSFDSLVFQALLYVNLIITPSYRGTPTCDTYQFLNLLYKAHWFHRGYEGPYKNLIERHGWYFRLSSTLPQTEFIKTPRVIFLLPENTKWERLTLALEVIQQLDFADYKHYVSQRLGNGAKKTNRLLRK
jgi:hypothetical protein